MSCYLNAKVEDSMDVMTSKYEPAPVSPQWRWKTILSAGLLCSAMLTGTAVAQSPSEIEASQESLEQVSPESQIAKSAQSDNGLELSDEAIARFNLLVAADQLYLDDRKSEATLLYQQAKADETRSTPVAAIPEPTFEVKGGAVKIYWREGSEGLAQGLDTKTIVALNLLTEKNPEFIPGHLKLAEAHNLFDRPEDALAALERGATVYPNVPELQEALMKQQANLKHWLPAAITARQFATLNPEHERAAEFLALSGTYQQKFQATLRENITSNAIGSVVTGALSVGLTGNPFGAISPIQNAIALLRGENSVGESAATSYRKKLPMLEDEAVNAYINRIGQKLVAVSGREMAYEFFVVNDDRINAFALPGGKIFIHSGAILKSRSEAELAGLMAHELSHAVLSHGFQMYTKSKATGGVTQLIPFSGIFSKVAVTQYSRDMEEQADLLGTRILANAGYAADGLENLSRHLLEADDVKDGKSLFGTHPETENRIQYLGELIERNGYNRYAYEGVGEHSEMQKLAQIAFDQLQAEMAEKGKGKQPISQTSETTAKGSVD